MSVREPFDIGRLCEAALAGTLHEEMCRQRAVVVIRNYDEYISLKLLFEGQVDIPDGVFERWLFKRSSGTSADRLNYADGFAINVDKNVSLATYNFGWCYPKYYAEYGYECFNASDVITPVAAAPEFDDLF